MSFKIWNLQVVMNSTILGKNVNRFNNTYNVNRPDVDTVSPQSVLV